MSDTKDRDLSVRAKLFCTYIVEGMSGVDAAIKAGYAANSARIMASRLMKTPKIIELIAELRKPAIEKAQVSEEYVLVKLKRFAEANVKDYFDFSKGTMSLKDFTELTKEQTDCIQEIKETKDGIQFKLVDKKGSVVDIGKSLNMFNDKVDVSHSGEVNIVIRDLTNESVED